MVIGGLLQGLSRGREYKAREKLDKIAKKDIFKLSRKNFINKYNNNSEVKELLETINGEMESQRIPFIDKNRDRRFRFIL